MPRNRRIEIPGAIYHVVARGIERCLIFKDSKDRNEFVRRLEEGLKTADGKCYAWALMPNHFHLVLRMGKRPLSELMKKLLTGYAVYFNRRHRRAGHLYQNRYKSILCQEDVYLLELIRYVHLNPLRGSLVSNIDALTEYPWSGHAVLAGARAARWQSVGEILERFGKKRSEAAKRYKEFVKDGVSMGKRQDLSGGGLRRSAGGWQCVLELKKNGEAWQGDERILGDGEFVNLALKESNENIKRRDKLKAEGWDIKRLAEYVCRTTGIGESDLMKRGRGDKKSLARDLFAYWGKREMGLKGSEIASYFGISQVAISKSIRRGEVIAKGNYYKFIS